MAGVKALQITEENGYSVINIRQTVSDQAYCDPDEGYLPSGQLSNCSSGHLRLPDDSPLRKWAKEVEGVVLVDSMVRWYILLIISMIKQYGER